MWVKRGDSMEILDRGFVKLSMERVARSATVRNDGVLFEAFFTKPLYRSLFTGLSLQSRSFGFLRTGSPEVRLESSL